MEAHRVAGFVRVIRLRTLGQRVDDFAIVYLRSRHAAAYPERVVPRVVGNGGHDVVVHSLVGGVGGLRRRDGYRGARPLELDVGTDAPRPAHVRDILMTEHRAPG